MGVSPPFAAIKRNDIETLKWCLSNQCDPKVKSSYKETPLHRAMEYDSDPESTCVLLEHLAGVDEIYEFERIPLHELAISFNRDEEDVLTKASMLLDAGASPTKPDALDQTPFFLSAE